MLPPLKEDRQSSVNLGDERALPEWQACAEILYRAAELSGLIRVMDEAPTLAVGMES